MRAFLLLLGIIKSVFAPNDVPQQATIILGGDVMLGRTVMTSALDKNDYNYPFRGTSDVLKSADITFVNLENPITKGCKPDPTRSSMIFCAKPEMLNGLVFAGIDIVNLANNHTQNHGKSGFEETKKFLQNRDINFSGDGNLVIKEVNGTRFGFVGFEKSQQISPTLTNQEKNLIMEANSGVDVLIVSTHWGVEYQDKALPGVQKLAHEIVGLGADVVVGHHPHWVQNIEYHNGVPIYYSLGNLVFDQMWSEKTKEGLMVKLTFEDGKIINQELIKTYMAEWAQPQIINMTSPKL